ncbi:type VI secretion system secreted protein VgrG, partial [Oxalobacteraceae bacterium GrIS 1.11]
MSNALSSLKDLVSARQHKRILRLSFPNNDGPQCEFVVNKLDAFEGLSRDFEFTIEILANDSTLALKDLQGKLMSVEMVQQGGTLRYFSGYCFSFRLKRAGNITFYEARLSPWLKYLSLRNDSYIFHNKTLSKQATDIFGDYAGIAKWELRHCADQEPMTEAVQYNESDHNYLNRRWEAAGIHHFYEHNAKGHVLIISANSTRAEPIDGNSDILFHRHAGSTEENSISDWSPVRHITPGRMRVGTFDFKNREPWNSSASSLNQQGRVPSIESYEYTGAYGFKHPGDGKRLSALRMSEMDATGKLYEAVGNNTYVQPGRWCSLVDRHGRYPFGDNRDINANKFLIVEVHHTATNNYLQHADEAPHYSNRLTCIRKSVPWRPGRSFNSVDTKIFGPQTAIVVGPKGQGSIHTDEFGRIRVQFMWDREGELNEVSSAWIRVSSSWAGAQLGAAAIPRVGSEVVVMWLDSSPDRPLVTGCIHNALYMPPWSLPSQKALTGFRSRELAQDGGNTSVGRSNHLILDDSDQQIQAQLKSDHQHSQLSLGHITRIDSNAGRMDARGEGFALETGGAGALRSAKGLLLSTDGRARAVGGILSRDELVSCLEKALDIAKGLGQAAADHQGGKREIKPQQDLTEAVDSLGHGVGDETKATGPGAAGQPVIAISAAAGIASATPKDQTHYAGQNIDTVAGHNQQHYAAQSILSSAGKDIEQFSLDGDIRLIANKGRSQRPSATPSPVRCRHGENLQTFDYSGARR